MRPHYDIALDDGVTEDDMRRVVEEMGGVHAQTIPAADKQLYEQIWRLPDGSTAIRYVHDRYVAPTKNRGLRRVQHDVIDGMPSEPSPAVQEFFRAYIHDQQDLVLTIKGAAGASINIDGPFSFRDFDWPNWRPRAGEPLETVIQPTDAKTREHGESSVHLHVPWRPAGIWVRLHHVKMKLIDHERRISFYASQPSTAARGDELFWFYARAGHPLDQHPVIGGPPRYGQDWDQWGDALHLP
jgi:hypothetical protein